MHFSKNSLDNLQKLNSLKILHTNRYIDTDYLCQISKKVDSDEENFIIDDYEKILNFFERWDLETQFYLGNK